MDLEATLQSVFGKREFRPQQREIIEAVLDGHDVFVQAATSFGKSLCFQLPAVILNDGITIVVTPLVALMNDQVTALKRAGIAVAWINGSTRQIERRNIMRDLLSGHPRIRLLYVTPELCAQSHFRQLLIRIHAKRELSRLAIDEAHCVSEWGHDFRPAYAQLSWFRHSLSAPLVPITCVTATATARVRDDILRCLGMDPNRVRVFCGPVIRENLHFEVRFRRDVDDSPSSAPPHPNNGFSDLVNWIRHVNHAKSSLYSTLSPPRSSSPVCGIIYTPTRSICESLSRRLESVGITAVAFHAGLPPEQRTACVIAWSKLDIFPNNDTPDAPNSFLVNLYRQKFQRISVIVATTAFGMGIDRPDVRFVIHWGLPHSFESFYQEAGRAGRDGKAAMCILWYAREDLTRAYAMLKRLTQSDDIGQTRLASLKALIDYCESVHTCRHHAILTYFSPPSSSSPLPPCVWSNQSLSRIPHILRYVGEISLADSFNISKPLPPPNSLCFWACDVCKEGPHRIAARKSLGLDLSSQDC